MNIIVRLVNQYGQQNIVPVCDTAKVFAQLAGTKTLTPGAVKLIKQLGYTVNVEQTLPVTL